MPYQGPTQEYDSRLGKTKVGLARHGQAYRSFFGCGPKKCFEDGKSWGEHGCSDRERLFWEHLQLSTPVTRAEDLKLRSELFTGVEAEHVKELDASVPVENEVIGHATVSDTLTLAQQLRGVIPRQRAWSAPYSTSEAGR